MNPPPARFALHLCLALMLSLLSPLAGARDGAVESLRETGKAFAAVAREVSPAVVFIQVEGRRNQAGGSRQHPFGDSWPFGDEFFRRFFGDEFPGRPAPRGDQAPVINQGSGFIFSLGRDMPADRSYILTNAHVVRGGGNITVKLQDNREFEAELVGTDPKSDIAVVAVAAPGLPALELGDSSRLDVGEWVVAMGNPFGLSHTLTVGVVSAKGRTSLGISDYEDFIQTDAAINPGNSGGPLVNLDSEVVGINTAIFSRSGGYMGVGFAIPSNLARTIAGQLVAHGEVTRGYLGVMIQPLTRDLAQSFGLENQQGVLISQVGKDSPAQAAGLEAGDIVIAYKGRPVTDTGDFRNRVALTPPGATVPLEVIRNGKRRTLEVTIDHLSDERLARGSDEQVSELGITVQPLTAALAERFEIEGDEGVVVTRVDPRSVAAMAGIRPGTLILEVDRRPVSSPAEFRAAIERSRGRGEVLLRISQNGASRYLVLRWR